MISTWWIPHNRQLPEKLREKGGRISADLSPTGRLISHAFINPAKVYAKNGPKAGSSIIAQITVTQATETIWDPNPRQEAVNPNVPAQWGLILMRDSADPFSEINSRIFSTKRVDLKPGTHRIEVPLQPLLWGSVYGKNMATKKALWNDIWEDRCFIGICFGGNFYAHGVAVSAGSARITIDTLKFKA